MGVYFERGGQTAVLPKKWGFWRQKQVFIFELEMMAGNWSSLITSEYQNPGFES